MLEKFTCKFCDEGDEPSFSTGICGSTTAGHGRLDDFGYWEHPCPVAMKKAREIDERYKHE